jgi:hypothetical protein
MDGRPDRRRFLTSLTLGGLAPLAAPLATDATAEAAARATFAAVDDLGLEPAVRADLEAFAQPVLQEAAWLEELPLDDVDPAFVFVPRG